MGKRPEFSPTLTVEEFEQHYWYKEELQRICRQYRLPASGTKAELERYVKRFLAGQRVADKRLQNTKQRTKKALKEMTLDTRLIPDGFKFNQQARAFFAEYFQVEKFSFTKEMAAALTYLRQKSPTSKRKGAPAPVKVGDECRFGVAKT
jgi:hypothetical protein